MKAHEVPSYVKTAFFITAGIFTVILPFSGPIADFVSAHTSHTNPFA